MNHDTTIWKDIPGYEGLYQVSNTGLVRRSDHDIHKNPGSIASIHKDRKGYLNLKLRTGLYEPWRHCKVHRLVAAAFIGECPLGYVVNHKNGVRDDNRPENLEYMTPKENTHHGIHVLGSDFTFNGGKNIADNRGVNAHSAKLDDEKVRQIRSLAASGIKQKEIALQFGITRPSVSMIVNHKTWRHVD